MPEPGAARQRCCRRSPPESRGRRGPSAGTRSSALEIAATTRGCGPSRQTPTCRDRRSRRCNRRRSKTRAAATRHREPAGIRHRSTLPAGVSMMSNPSDDGRYVAAMVNETGDAAIVDLTAGTYRPLDIVNADGTNGYASNTTISPDGTNIAVSWYLGYKGALHVIRADGSGHRVLVDDIDFNVYQWSRDGSLILTAIANPDGTNSNLPRGSDRRRGSAGPHTGHGMAGDDDVIPRRRGTSPTITRSQGRSRTATYSSSIHTQARSGRWSSRLLKTPARYGHPTAERSCFLATAISRTPRGWSRWRMAVLTPRHDFLNTTSAASGRAGSRAMRRSTINSPSALPRYTSVAIEGSSSPPQPVSPRQALSNYCPAWSRDGRFIAYSSERRSAGPREIWLYDTTTGQEQRVPAEQKLGRPWVWSPDDRQILVFGQNDGRLFILDRISGKTKLVSTLARKGGWLPEGIVFIRDKTVILQDPDSGRQIRRLDFWIHAL